MLDLSQSPEQIAENLKKTFNSYLMSLPLHPEPSKEDIKFFQRTVRDCAILCVENMLEVCPQYDRGVFTKRPRENPDYLKLTQTLKVLRAE